MKIEAELLKLVGFLHYFLAIKPHMNEGYYKLFICILSTLS